MNSLIDNKYINTYIIINKSLILIIYKVLYLKLLLLLRFKLLKNYNN